eukprot:11789-Heterococcus_DN1.PRE.2
MLSRAFSGHSELAANKFSRKCRTLACSQVKQMLQTPDGEDVHANVRLHQTMRASAFLTSMHSVMAAKSAVRASLPLLLDLTTTSCST